jgi:small conductance mechanosensitive channel
MDFQKLYTKAYDSLLLYGPRIVIAFLVLFAGLWFIRVLRGWIHKALKKRFSESRLIPFIVSLCITAFHVLLVMMVLQILGIQMTLFAALIAALGVAIGLALSGTLQNITSGILILILKPSDLVIILLLRDRRVLYLQ